MQIETLKDSNYFNNVKRNKEGYNWGIIFSQQANGYQFFLPNDDYYMEVSSRIRGGVVERDIGNFTYDIATAPASSVFLRQVLINILGTKINNEIRAVNELLRILREEKQIEGEDINGDEIFGLTKIVNKNKYSRRIREGSIKEKKDFGLLDI